jgi:hypothetical protein
MIRSGGRPSGFMELARVYVCLTWAQYLEPTQHIMIIAGAFTMFCKVLFAESIECAALYFALCILVKENTPATRVYGVWDVLAQTLFLFLNTNLPFYLVVDACWNDVHKTWLFATVCAVGWVMGWNHVYTTIAVLCIQKAWYMFFPVSTVTDDDDAVSAIAH